MCCRGRGAQGVSPTTQRAAVVASVELGCYDEVRSQLLPRLHAASAPLLCLFGCCGCGRSSRCVIGSHGRRGSVVTVSTDLHKVHVGSSVFVLL